MAIPRLTTDLQVISKLDDRPNDTNGLTAAGLKAKFDESGGDIKTYINDTMLPFLESASAATEIGVDLSDENVDNVQDAFEKVFTDMQGITQGAVADGSITAAKLANDLTYAAVNLDAKQVRMIYVTTTAPTTASPDGIYLVTGS